MGFAGLLGSRIGDGQSLKLCHSPAQCLSPRLANSKACHVRRSDVVRTMAKAAAVEAPAKVASAGKPSNSKGSLAKLTPEECSDIYRDMKLGR